MFTSTGTDTGTNDDPACEHAQSLEEALRRSEARLRAAHELVGLGIYSWNPLTGALDWDDRLRAMWGLPPGTAVDMDVYEAGIHPEDLQRVRSAIAACVDPAGDGRYNIEYRVRGHRDGVIRHISTSGRTTFHQGRAVSFIGAAIDVTAHRLAEAAIRASEARFSSFAANSSNVLWMADLAAGAITYRSAAWERIWGAPELDGPAPIAEWLRNVHPDDRQQALSALAGVREGECVQFQYRMIRPDGAVRWLRDTSFPIPDGSGTVTRIGGITEDVTQQDFRHVYIVSTRCSEARRLAGLLRSLGYHARTFDGVAEFLDIAAVLAPGCVLVDLRKNTEAGLRIPRELMARSVRLPIIALDAPGGDITIAVAAMKAGAVDYVVVVKDESALRAKLSSAVAESHGAMRPAKRDENAGARVARLTPREREVLHGLVEGGTNKAIGLKLGISPRTVELHRAQLMNRLNATSLTEVLQTALAAGIAPTSRDRRTQRRSNGVAVPELRGRE